MKYHAQDPDGNLYHFEDWDHFCRYLHEELLNSPGEYIVWSED